MIYSLCEESGTVFLGIVEAPTASGPTVTALAIWILQGGPSETHPHSRAFMAPDSLS